jgi:DNA-binding transcriptional ArsR family regulator
VAQRAAAHVRALADLTRLSIALALREGEELCVRDLAWIVSKAENLVGHHLRALRDAGVAGSRERLRPVIPRRATPRTNGLPARTAAAIQGAVAETESACGLRFGRLIRQLYICARQMCKMIDRVAS